MADNENNEKITEVIEKCIVDLLLSAGRVNDYMKNKDFARNHTNYGRVSRSADVLILLGKSVDLACYEDEGYLVIPKVTIDGRITEFKY